MERVSCIWCQCRDLSKVFPVNKTFPAASYTTETPVENAHWIPYNVQRCFQCRSYQIQYLGDPKIVYGKNHAYSHGNTLRDMCTTFRDFILESSSLRDVLEIGAGNGYLADMLVPHTNSYIIVDPSYFGNTNDRHIVPKFIEDYDCIHETVIMSHVFEHFYNPREILRKISTARHVYLNFPDLESYVQSKTFHVLNPEHTFFVENDFLASVFEQHGLVLRKKLSFRGHSVFFHFERVDGVVPPEFPTNRNSDALVSGYFRDVQTIVDRVNSMESCYLWPCSMHSQFLIAMGIEPKRVLGLLDNCKEKHGTYMYGYRIPCIPYSSTLDSVIHNGGCFNRELVSAHDTLEDGLGKVDAQ